MPSSAITAPWRMNAAELAAQDFGIPARVSHMMLRGKPLFRTVDRAPHMECPATAALISNPHASWPS